MSSLSSYASPSPSSSSAPPHASTDESTASLLPAFASGVRWTTPKPALLQSRRQSGGVASPALSATSAAPSITLASTTSVSSSSSSSSTSSAASSTLTTPPASYRTAPHPHSSHSTQQKGVAGSDLKSRADDSKQHSPDLSFGDVSLDGDLMFSADEDEEDEGDERASEASPYSSAQPSPSEKSRLRSERRRRRSQLDNKNYRTPEANHHNNHSRHSFSLSSTPNQPSLQHSRRSSTSTTAAQPSFSSAEQPLHDANIVALLLPLSTSLPLPTLHSRLSSLRSALHASHRQLTEYRSLLSDKQQQQSLEKQINYDLFMKVKEQDEHIQWLTHAIKQHNGSNSSSGTTTPNTDGDTERLTLRGMRGVALHAAHMQLREMMGEVDQRANEIRRLEEQVRTLKIEKEARSEGDSNEIERLRQEVAVLMGKLAVEAEEREQRDRERSKNERKLEKQLEKLRQQRQSLEHDLLQSSAEVNTLSSALSQVRSQHSTLTFDHQRLMDEKAKVETEREGWRKRYEDVMDEVDTMRSEMREAREVSDGIGRLVEGSDSLEVQRVRDECERKNAAMQEEVRAMERAVMDTKRSMDTEVETRAQQQTSALYDEVRQLREERERESEQLRTEVSASRHDQEEAEAENEQLRQRLRQLTQQLDQAVQANTATATATAAATHQTTSSQTDAADDHDEQDEGSARNSGVDPSLLAVLRAELDSVRTINHRLIAAQQQADTSARSQLETARKQLTELEGRLHDSEQRAQQLQVELSRVQTQLEAQRQHKQRLDDEKTQRRDEKESEATSAFQQREKEWQYERSQMLQSLSALTAESREREGVVSALMDKIAALEGSAQRAARTVEREQKAPSTATASLSSSVNGYSHPTAHRSPTVPQISAPVASVATSHSLTTVSPAVSLSSLSPALPLPASPSPVVNTVLTPRPVPMSPAAGDLLSDSLLDQLASRLAAKLTHSDTLTLQPTRPTSSRPATSTSSTSPARARRADDVTNSSRAGGTSRSSASSADIAAEMAAIYRQLEGKSRTFSHFAQNNTSNGRSVPHPAVNDSHRHRRHTDAGSGVDEDDETKEAEQDDYIPLIRRTVGGHAPAARTQPVSRPSTAASTQPHAKHHRASTKPVRVSHVHSPISSSVSSTTSSPSSPTRTRPAVVTSPPMSPCSLSPSLSSSAASSLTSSPVYSRVTTGSSVLFGGSVKLQQQQQRSSGRTR